MPDRFVRVGVSDGTKSFGPSPQRAFADNGVYDGQLTATDITGLSGTESFTVSVSNVKPSVNAGPDTTADWGRLVQFNGQATDPRLRRSVNAAIHVDVRGRHAQCKRGAKRAPRIHRAGELCRDARGLR